MTKHNQLQANRYLIYNLMNIIKLHLSSTLIYIHTLFPAKKKEKKTNSHIKFYRGVLKVKVQFTVILFECLCKLVKYDRI